MFKTNTYRIGGFVSKNLKQEIKAVFVSEKEQGTRLRIATQDRTVLQEQSS